MVVSSLHSSYSGEDVAEFHLHGSPAVVKAVLESLSKIPSFRPAEAGEFTKRAFMNGRMSFLEVEALGDLLNAETEQQRRQAMQGVMGAFTKKCWEWRKELMKNLAIAEVCVASYLHSRQSLTSATTWTTNLRSSPMPQRTGCISALKWRSIFRSLMFQS